MIENLPSLVSNLANLQIVQKNAINEMDVQVMNITMTVMKITSALPTQGARKMLGVHKMQAGLHAIFKVVITRHFMVRLYFLKKDKKKF